jgi:hypothetical protein
MNDHVALREFIEVLIAAESRRRDELRAADHAALALQAAEYERRLIALNGEHARIAKSQETYVSRELWERAQADAQQWRAAVAKDLQVAVTKAEFYTYKDATDRALTLAAGEATGMSRSGAILISIIGAAAAVATVVGLILVLTRG